MKKLLGCIFLSACMLASAKLRAEEMSVGIGRKLITPQDPIWLNGYASAERARPATGVAVDLWAKALVFEQSAENRVVVVTLDILGLSHEISETVTARLAEKYGLKRSQILLNSSHTHAGPVIWPACGMFDYKLSDMQAVFRYTQQLTENIIAVVDMAMANLAPMKVWSGHGVATFAKNRRDPAFSAHPVDDDVPVLKITTAEGELKAILFGYACHNTTLFGNYMEVSGDYAGYAQLDLEKMYPGITALFFQGCCGDIDPSPRGTIENAMANGQSLAESVQKVLTGTLSPVGGPIRTHYETIQLEFRPFELHAYEQEILSDDEFKQRRAKLMLQAYNKGWDISKYSYPLQSIRFGKDLSILAMAGEVVVDYSLWAKKEFGGENLFVAGYSNEVMSYIPTKRILGEGGYEPDLSMIYYVLPGPFADDVEDRIKEGVVRVMKGIGIKPSGK